VALEVSHSLISPLKELAELNMLFYKMGKAKKIDKCNGKNKKSNQPITAMCTSYKAQ
jgi:hypothetical protein